MHSSRVIACAVLDVIMPGKAIPVELSGNLSGVV